MSKGSPLLAFAAGLGGGFLDQEEAKRKQGLDAQDRKMRQETHDLQMEEANRIKQDRIGLGNAAAPTGVTEGANGMVLPDSMDNRDVGQPDTADQPNGGLSLGGFKAAGQTFTNRPAADAAVTTYNSQPATDQRISLAMAKSGNVLGAKQYEASALQGQSAAGDMADKQWSRQIRTAMDSGHDGLAALVSKSETGPMKGQQIKAVPSADGSEVTYHKVNPDGSTTPVPNLTFSNDQDGVTQAAYMLDRTVTPEHRYTQMITEGKSDATNSLKMQELKLKERELTEAKIPTAEAKVALAEVRAQLADLRGAGASDKVSREERLRYTTLFSDSGRRMNEAQKAIGTLQRDIVFMSKANKPGSPEAQELAGMRENLASLGEERKTYQSLLAGSQGGNAAPPPAALAPSTAPADVGATPAGTPGLGQYDTPPSRRGPNSRIAPAAQAASEADRSKVLGGELAKAQAGLATSADPEERARLTGDVAAVQKELGRQSPASRASASAVTPPQTGPIQVASKAERDKLPKGTKYRAPNGDVYIKN